MNNLPPKAVAGTAAAVAHHLKAASGTAGAAANALTQLAVYAHASSGSMRVLGGQMTLNGKVMEFDEGVLTYGGDVPVNSIIKCRHCGRYIERAPDDDEYVQIELGLTEAWHHAKYFVACNPGSEGERKYHEPESLSTTWARELPRMIQETDRVVSETTAP